MQTVVTERGQVSIPSPLRKKFHLIPGTGVEWLEMSGGIFLMPVPRDPIAVFRGSGRGRGSTQQLLEERRKERVREK